MHYWLPGTTQVKLWDGWFAVNEPEFYFQDTQVKEWPTFLSCSGNIHFVQCRSQRCLVFDFCCFLLRMNGFILTPGYFIKHSHQRVLFLLFFISGNCLLIRCIPLALMMNLFASSDPYNHDISLVVFQVN